MNCVFSGDKGNQKNCRQKEKPVSFWRVVDLFQLKGNDICIKAEFPESLFPVVIQSRETALGF